MWARRSRKTSGRSARKINTGATAMARLHRGIVFTLLWTFLTAYSETSLIDEGPSLYSDGYLHDIYHSGLRKMSMKAKTVECRLFIEYEFMNYIRAFVEESPFPFEDEFFHSQCPSAWDAHPPMLPANLQYLPPAPEYPDNPTAKRDAIAEDKLSILYVMLVHSHADFAARLVAALDEPQHTFVIHVDLKASDVYNQLRERFAGGTTENGTGSGNVFVMGSDRQSVNWGGYSVVNATIQSMRFAWEHLGHRPFDYLIDISGTSYPLKSNAAIRRELAQNPGAVYMDVHTSPSVPPPDMWYHYVECDDAVHRIGRLAILRGMNMHVGSQWFAYPKHLVQWLLVNPLPYQYRRYAQHVVVADENYFATLFMNSPYCEDLVPKNLLFVLFDKWENERNESPGTRDTRKCLSPDPDHCGRSPTTLTVRYKKLLEISRAMFARKFDPDDPESMGLVDEIDKWRAASSAGGGGGGRGGSSSRSSRSGGDDSAAAVGDEGNSMMIRFSGLRATATTAAPGDYSNLDLHLPDTLLQSAYAQTQSQSNTLGSASDICWEMHQAGEGLTLTKCNPLLPSQWFTLGPCTDNSNVTIEDGACALPQEDQEEMYCQLQSTSRNLCVDINGESPYAGTSLIGWECSGQWNQLFRILANCTISAVQPDLVGRVRGFEEKNLTMCFQPDNNLNIVSVECEPPPPPPAAAVAAVATDTYNDAGTAADLSSGALPLSSSAAAAAAAATQEDEEEEAEESVSAAAASASRRRMQRFEFLKKDGEAHKLYDTTITSSPRKSIDTTMRDAVGTPRESRSDINIPPSAKGQGGNNNNNKKKKSNIKNKKIPGKAPTEAGGGEEEPNNNKNNNSNNNSNNTTNGKPKIPIIARYHEL